mmetsp:Transcript_45862/g.67255  ORF Transcript_45862/g.67255 Transcript_45862/m.67255 type:complete len:369 (+) Transcript_45862:121-1227(+)
MADSSEVTLQFIETTGAAPNVAKFFIESASGDLMRALDSFFESGGEVPEGGADAPMGDAGEDDESDDDLDEEELGRAEAGAGPASLDDLTSNMFKKAEQVKPEDLAQEQKDPKRSIFKGKGFALGKDSAEDSEVVDSGPARPAPKAYKVTVWKGGAFQVDDGEVRYCDKGSDQEKNKRFMEDLGKNIPPEEMRERDTSGFPVPVNISLADHREEDSSNATVVKPKFKAFGGGGNTLGKDWTSEAFTKVAAAADAPEGSAARSVGTAAAAPKMSKDEISSQLKDFEADASSADATSVQVRLPTGGRAEARLSAARTVGDLRRWVVASGNVPAGQNFLMNAGFPPQPLTDDSASLKDAQLCNAAVVLRLV